MSVSDVYERDQRVGMTTAFRTVSKTITWTALLLDAFTSVYTVLMLALTFNLFRMPVYHPGQMRPWQAFITQPYWRIFAPVALLWVTPIFLQMLVFYPYGIALVGFLILTVPGLVFGWIGWFWMVVDDWKNCSERLWCACITDYTVTAGVIIPTYCPTGSGETGVFVAQVFLWLAVLLVCMGMAFFSFFLHSEYAVDNAAYEANNANRSLISGEASTVPMLGHKGRKKV